MHAQSEVHPRRDSTHAEIYHLTLVRDRCSSFPGSTLFAADGHLTINVAQDDIFYKVVTFGYTRSNKCDPGQDALAWPRPRRDKCCRRRRSSARYTEFEPWPPGRGGSPTSSAATTGSADSNVGRRVEDAPGPGSSRGSDQASRFARSRKALPTRRTPRVPVLASITSQEWSGLTRKRDLLNSGPIVCFTRHSIRFDCGALGPVRTGSDPAGEFRDLVLRWRGVLGALRQRRHFEIVRLAAIIMNLTIGNMRPRGRKKRHP